MTRLALLSDIHGNLLALEAVQADLRRQRPDQVWLAGDLVNRCPWNREVLDLIRAEGWPTIQGNHDLIIGRFNPPANRPPMTDPRPFPALWWIWQQLEPHHRAFLRALPPEARLDFGDGPPIRLCHAVPGDAFVGLYPELSDSALCAHLAGVDELVFVCGHTHRPMARRVDGRLILNAGSVGLPYNGDPQAQYLLLDSTPAGWHATLRAVEYDRSQLPRAFIDSGMLAEAGPVAELFLRTALTGEPWASDFGQWLRAQPAALQQDLAPAVSRYLQQHGPGRWAFLSASTDPGERQP